MAVAERYVFVVGILVWCASGAHRAHADDIAKPVKNVIVLIADGCSSEQYTLARWFQGKPLALDAILVGGVKDYAPGDPLRQLRGFRRLHLRPGESSEVSFVLASGDLPQGRAHVSVGGGQPVGAVARVEGDF